MVGGAISGSPHSYLMFALPGIIVQNALFATLNTGMGLSTDLDKGFLHRLRALPIARFAPLTGRILADLVKQAWAIVLLLGVGAAAGAVGVATFGRSGGRWWYEAVRSHGRLRRRRRRTAARAAATKVDFFTVAREAGT